MRQDLGVLEWGLYVGCPCNEWKIHWESSQTMDKENPLILISIHKFSLVEMTHFERSSWRLWNWKTFKKYADETPEEKQQRKRKELLPALVYLGVGDHVNYRGQVWHPRAGEATWFLTLSWAVLHAGQLSLEDPGICHTLRIWWQNRRISHSIARCRLLYCHHLGIFLGLW